MKGDLVSADGLAGEGGRYEVVEGAIEAVIFRTWRLRFVPPDDWLQCAYCRGGRVDPGEVSAGVRPMCESCLDRRLDEQQ